MRMQAFRIPETLREVSIQDFLTVRLGLSRRKAKALLDSRQVFVNGRRTWMAHHRVHGGDAIEVPEEPAGTPQPDRVSVLYEDADYLVAHKPPGLLSNGQGSLETVLRERQGTPDLVAVHRLDRDTSGCLLIAKRQEAFDRAVEHFQQRKIVKLYEAIVAGAVDGQTRTITKDIDAAPAVTHIQVIDRNLLASHLRIRIDTGRTHQIRKHLAGIRHPVLGDKVYGTHSDLPPQCRHVERQMLHAVALQFVSPFGGNPIRVEDRLPDDFRRYLRRLRLK